MEKNYYDILEISKNASKEIVNKSYKVLVKKYHPDLQTDPVKKKQCEEKLKEINEAFETLSDEQKRTEYDAVLFNAAQEINNNYQSNNDVYQGDFYEQQGNYNNRQNNNGQQESHNNSQNNYQQSNTSNSAYNDNFNNTNPQYEDAYRKVYEEKQRQKQEYYNQKMQDAVNKAYHDAYIQDLKNRGYKIRYKKTFRDYLNSFIAILITIFVIFVVWQIPFVQNYFINLYNENEIIKFFVDFVLSIFGVK